MDAIHSSTNISRAFACQTSVKGNERFRIGTGRIQKGCRKHVHALHVRSRVTGTSLRAFSCGSGGAVRVSGYQGSMLKFRIASGGCDMGSGLALIVGSSSFFGIVKTPRYGVTETNKASLADTTAQERVRCESPECVIANFGVCWRGTAVDEVQIRVGV